MNTSDRDMDIVVKLSIGSLSLLKYFDLREKHRSRTIYMLQYSSNNCLGTCTYCFQNKNSSRSKLFLSRVTWYPVYLTEIISNLRKNIDLYERICIQTILKENFVHELLSIINILRENSIDKPISVASTPVHVKVLEKLGDFNVDYIGVGLDTATPFLFSKYCKPYSWETYWEFIEKALTLYGCRRVFVHLIIGLGEDFYDLIKLINELISIGADIALFPYVDWFFKTRVDLLYIRLVQITRYLLLKGYSLNELFRDNKFRREFIIDIVENIDKYIDVFLTSGCPGCNRPYYTESPRGPFYNIYSVDHFYEYRDDLLRELRSLMGSNLVE